MKFQKIPGVLPRNPVREELPLLAAPTPSTAYGCAHGNKCPGSAVLGTVHPNYKG
jgi:hypothetical protein